MKGSYLVATAAIVGLAAMPLAVSAAPYGNMGQNQTKRGWSLNAGPQYQTTTQLTAEEKATVQRLLEEEKLAGDLYSAFYTKWGNEVFNRIAASEARHETAAERLATTYGVSDTRTTTAGTFTNTELQALYDSLLAKGMQSEAAALDVAKQFETDDIAGLKAAQEVATATRLDRVLGNLKRASEYHLNEFTAARNALN